MNIPSTLTAGDLWSWTDSVSDYPASSWTLTYYFRGPQSFSVVASASGDEFSISVAAATTAGYKPGGYQWQARVVKGSEQYTVGSGQISVAPDLSITGSEYRTWEQRALESVRAVLEDRATHDQLSFTIAGRSLQRMSSQELWDNEARLAARVAKQLGDSPGRIFVRFGQS